MNGIAILVWFPFSGSIGRIALIVASLSYLVGLGVVAIRRAALLVALGAAVVGVVFGVGWSTRLASIAIGVSCALLFSGRFPTDVPEAPDEPVSPT